MDALIFFFCSVVQAHYIYGDAIFFFLVMPGHVKIRHDAVM